MTMPSRGGIHARTVDITTDQAVGDEEAFIAYLSLQLREKGIVLYRGQTYSIKFDLTPVTFSVVGGDWFVPPGSCTDQEHWGYLVFKLTQIKLHKKTIKVW